MSLTVVVAGGAEEGMDLLALAEAPSVLRAAQVSTHAAIAMWLLERLGAARLDVPSSAGAAFVHVHPRLARH